MTQPSDPPGQHAAIGADVLRQDEDVRVFYIEPQGALRAECALAGGLEHILCTWRLNVNALEDPYIVLLFLLDYGV